MYDILYSRYVYYPKITMARSAHLQIVNMLSEIFTIGRWFLIFEQFNKQSFLLSSWNDSAKCRENNILSVLNIAGIRIPERFPTS